MLSRLLNYNLIIILNEKFTKTINSNYNFMRHFLHTMLTLLVFLLSLNAQKTTITNLEVDKLISPIGLDNKNPDFSWIINSEEL